MGAFLYGSVNYPSCWAHTNHKHQLSSAYSSKACSNKMFEKKKKREKGNITSFNSKVEIVGRNWFNGWFKIIISGTMTWTLFLLMWTTKARQIILEAYLLFPPTDWRKKNRCWSHNNHILSVGLETGRLLPMLCIRITHIPQMVAFEHLLNISPFCLLFNTDNGIILQSLTFFFEHILRWNCFFFFETELCAKIVLLSARWFLIFAGRDPLAVEVSNHLHSEIEMSQLSSRCNSVLFDYLYSHFVCRPVLLDFQFTYFCWLPLTRVGEVWQVFFISLK